MQERWDRRAAWLVSGTAVLALGLSLPRPASAQAPVHKGMQFQVNTYTTNYQYAGSVAADADGDFVVVWESNGSSGTDTSGNSIHAQRYASNGSKQGVQFQVNAYTTGHQLIPSVAAEANGDFVVVWESNGSPGTDTTGYSIQAQRYASNGSMQGPQFQVNTYTSLSQYRPIVSADANGDFVVVWESNGSSGTDTTGYSIQGQRYASSGSAQGAQFQVNTYTTDNQRYPSVAADSDADFVVVWQSNGSSGTDTTGYSVQGQRYGSDGSPRGPQFQVNSYTTNGQGYASVAADPDGDFVVVWQSFGSSGTDTSSTSIQGRRYASNGLSQGGEFQVNAYTANGQGYASVAAHADGDFVVVWGSYGSPGTDASMGSIQGQRYASDGSTEGDQFQVNTYTTSAQNGAFVAAKADEVFVVAWSSQGSSGTDTSFSSVQGQRYGVPAVPAMSAATRFALGAALLALGAVYALRRRS